MPEPNRLLTPAQEEEIREVRTALQDLQTALARIPAEPDDERTLRSSILQLDDFFLLVIVGEFNAGKSAVINALLGVRTVEEGVTPTTQEVQVLRFAGQEAGAAADDIRSIPAEAEILRDIRLVDTPGTNAITREHQAITERFVPRADLILFITSVDRPFTESERQFMERIREWGKKVVIVINKIDILSAPGDLEKVTDFVRDSVHAMLGFAPDLFPVSAKAAFRAKQQDDADALVSTGFTALETYIRTKLDDRERFRLKLLNPLGIGLRLREKYARVVDDRLTILADDVATVEKIRTLLEGYRQEMKRGFELRLSEVDNVLHQFEKKGNEFFEETVRARRIFDLMNKDKIQADFEREVVADLPQQITKRVDDVIDWLVSSDLQQWQEVRDRLVARRSEQSDRIAGRLSGGFEYDRARLLDTVGKSAQQALERHDHHAEAARMADSVRGAVANAALLQVGAVGLGTAVALIATTTAADITGILAAGVMATVGFFVLPRRRENAKRELRQRIAALREQLMGALTAQFEKEVARSGRRIEEAIAPYVQFVEGERTGLTRKQEELAALETRLLRLRTAASKA